MIWILYFSICICLTFMIIAIKMRDYGWATIFGGILSIGVFMLIQSFNL